MQEKKNRMAKDNKRDEKKAHNEININCKKFL